VCLARTCCLSRHSLLLPAAPHLQVVNAKAGAGSATLSMAYAAARMAESTLLGLAGEPSVFECAFVQSEVGGGLWERAC
jgi:malate/lactate dehydrogenase